MRVKLLMVTFIVLFANKMQGEDVISYLKQYSCVDSITMTLTNLSIKFKSSGLVTEQNGVYRRSREYAEANENFVLASGQGARLSARHVLLTFVPILFKGKQNGFKVIEITHNPYIGEATNNMYLALSDTPVQVSEADVEMIMENEEWKTFERSAKAEEPPPVVTVIESEPNVEEKTSEKELEITNEKSEIEKKQPYAMIVALGSVLILGIIFWVVRRKRK